MLYNIPLLVLLQPEYVLAGNNVSISGGLYNAPGAHLLNLVEFGVHSHLVMPQLEPYISGST